MTEQRELCRYCGRPLRHLYPQLEFRLQWGHASGMEANECPRPPGEWPRPYEPSGLDEFHVSTTLNPSPPRVLHLFEEDK